MSKSTTRQDSKIEPMDPNVTERAVAAPSENQPRVCYAVETLVAEVDALFPETPVEYHEVNGRNTALAAKFDLTTLDEPDRETVRSLLGLLVGDERVSDVDRDESAVMVTMRNNPRTQDVRDPFGIADALLVLEEREDSEEGFFVNVDGTEFDFTPDTENDKGSL